MKDQRMVTTQPTPIPMEYPSLLEELKKELVQDPGQSLTAFCEEHSIHYDSFNKWLRATGRGFVKLRREIRISSGMPGDSNELYLKCLDLLKAELNENVHLRFTDFCQRHKVNYRSMSSWLASNCLDFAIIRAQICMAKGLEIPRNCRRLYAPVSIDGDKARARFGKTLDTYREVLATNPRYSLKVHCGIMRTDYYDMSRWMKFMKISVRQLQIAARLNTKCPPNPSMVMIQFRANGGTRSDMFKGVTIICPDGKTIHVEECSVIELCTFLYTYDKDQRRK